MNLQPITEVLLPTSEATCIAIAPSGKLDFNKTTLISKMGWINQFAYLCIEGEIKENEISANWDGVNWSIGIVSKDHQKYVQRLKIISCNDPALNADGVSALPERVTKFITSLGDTQEVPFLPEFCRRYTALTSRGNDGQKLGELAFVDGVLARLEICAKGEDWTISESRKIIQALQSKTGYSSKDLATVLFMAREKENGVYKYSFDKIIQSLTPKQEKPKGVEMYCEMEERYLVDSEWYTEKEYSILNKNYIRKNIKPKRDSNGSPIIRFK